MSDTNDDFRQTLLARNANAVAATVEAQNIKIAGLLDRLEDAHTRCTALEQELLTLTERVNIMFVKALGNGATDGHHS